MYSRGHALFYTVAYLLLPLCWVLVLWGNGAYDRRYLGLGTEEFKRVFRAALVVVALVSFTAFSTKADPSRMAAATAMLGALAYILIGRHVARRALHVVRRRGQAGHRMLLVGALHEALEVHTAVSRNPAAGLVPVAIHITDGYAPRRQPSPLPVYVGRDILSVVREVGADTIAVCGSVSAEPGELRRLAWQLEGTGVDLVVAPQLTDIAGPRVHIRPVEGLPLLHVEEPTLSGPAWLVKTLIDRAVAAVGLILLDPALHGRSRSRSGSPTPGRCSSGRPGSAGRGKTFRVWKFRTMYVDAEDRLASLRTRTSPTDCCSRSGTIRGSSRSAGSCAPPRSTSCPS